MNLRYHAGGDEINPGLYHETITARMEFMPLDAEISANNTLKVTLLSTGEDYLPASTSSIVFIEEAGSFLLLDTFDPNSEIDCIYHQFANMKFVLLEI